MTAALARLIDDADLRLALGAAGKRKVEDEFTVERMTRKYEELYAELAGLPMSFLRHAGT